MPDSPTPPRRGRALAVGLVAAAAAIGVLVVLALASSVDEPVLEEPRPAAPAAPAGEAPPQIEAHLRDGGGLIDTPIGEKLEALRGVPVVVNQWASWCPPCRAEFPYFEQMAERYGDRIAFVGLNSRDQRAAARAFLAENPVGYPSIFDASAEQAREIGAGTSWPTTAYLDAEGEGVFIRFGGYADAKDLEDDILEHALGQPAG